MPVGAVEGLVAIENGLHVILAGRDIRQACPRIAGGRGVDGHRARAFHIGAEDLLGLELFGNLESRLGRVAQREDEHHVTVLRLRPGDLESEARLGLGASRRRGERRQSEKTHIRKCTSDSANPGIYFYIHSIFLFDTRVGNW